MLLHAQDAVVALKLALRKAPAPYAQLGSELGLSASQVHAAVKRAAAAGLLNAKTREVNKPALAEFLLHGLKYMCPAKPGPIVRGLPTGHSASPLRELLASVGEPLVWPDPNGEIRGESIEPLYRAAPMAARKDAGLYVGLALIDAIRAGRARERAIAAKMLQELLLGDEKRPEP